MKKHKFGCKECLLYIEYDLSQSLHLHQYYFWLF